MLSYVYAENKLVKSTKPISMGKQKPLIFISSNSLLWCDRSITFV